MAQSILLVDDDPQLARMLAQVAHARGMDVVVDGAGALTHRLDAAILRVRTENCRALGVLAALRQLGARAEIIAVVDHALVEPLAGELGDVFACLPAPVEPPQLFATLDRALERHRLRWELELLNEVAEIVGSALDVPSVMQRAAEHIGTAFHGTHVVVRLKAEGGAAPAIASVGISADTLNRLYAEQAGAWPSDRVLATGEATRIEDMGSYSMAVPQILTDELPGRSVLAAPIVAGGHVIGAVTVVAHQVGRFTREDERVLRSIGRQFGVAVSNGRLYEETRKAHTLEHAQARELRVLSEDLRLANAELVTTLERLRATQAQLVQAEKLTALGQLVAGVAHELNNPLTSVMGYAQLVFQQLSRNPDVSAQLPRFREDVARIVNEADRAARIIRNLLTFARRQSSRRVREDVGDLCRRAVDLRAYDLRLKGIEVTTSLPASLPPVLVDGGQIQQALLNLMLNAEQAMNDATARRLHLAVANEPQHCAVLIAVTDSGHGIEPANLKRVFDPFFTTRPVGEDTGLGLSIVHGIVRAHGGDVWVSSRAGVETTFFLRLPADCVTACGATAPKVLVVHADLDVRTYLAAMALGWGYDVEAAHSLRDALDRLDGFSGVVLLDEGMVGEDAALWEATWQQTTTAVLIALGDPAAAAAPFLRRAASAAVSAPLDVRQIRQALLEAGVRPPAA